MAAQFAHYWRTVPRPQSRIYDVSLRDLLRPWVTEGKNQTLVGAIPFCGEHPGPRFEDKFRSANQIDGISIADGGKWLTVNL